MVEFSGETFNGHFKTNFSTTEPLTNQGSTEPSTSSNTTQQSTQSRRRRETKQILKEIVSYKKLISEKI